MNSAATVTNKINNWKAEGHSKAELVVLIAEACLGWPYVWGGYGQYCTPANRRSYADRSSCPSGEAAQIRKKCQVLNGAADGCGGCPYYPSAVVRFFDCRGFTRWVLQQVGISLQGAGATSQWNDSSNWIQKGLIADMPPGAVCCVFKQNQTDHKTMEHTGFAFGDGQIIDCSGTVKRGKTTDRGWTHYAIPKGIGEEEPMPTMPTLRKGSKGEYVTLMQTKLIQLGYDLEPYGADGKFGNKTQSALIKFQNDHGLEADGICGPKTWEALEDGKVQKYTVTIRGVTKTAAEGIIRQYGGEMSAEE